MLLSYIEQVGKRHLVLMLLQYSFPFYAVVRMSTCRIRKYTTGSSSCASPQTTSEPNSLTNDLSAMIAARNIQDALFTQPAKKDTITLQNGIQKYIKE